MSLRLGLVLVAAAAIGCANKNTASNGGNGSGGNGAAGGDGAGGGGSAGSGAVAAAQAAVAAAARAAAAAAAFPPPLAPARARRRWPTTPGRSRRAGLMRTANVHTFPPATIRAAGMPLVLNFHGYSSNAAEEALLSGMNGKADSAGFISIRTPEGIGSSWNAGACCGQAVTDNVDDIGFVQGPPRQRRRSHLCVDAHRIFVTGMSNGGFFSHLLGCEARRPRGRHRSRRRRARHRYLHAIAPDAGHALPRHRRRARPLRRQSRRWASSPCPTTSPTGAHATAAATRRR